MTTNNNVSMIDVAKHAGVSATTVSHVLNNTRFVSESTRERVLDAIRELNYIPNASARTLKTGKTNKIQFVISDVDNYFFVSLIESIEDDLALNGYQLLLANTHEDWKREQNHLSSINKSSVDGLILSTAQMDWDILEKHLPKDIPVILIDRRPEGCTIDTVTISTYQAVYNAVADLYKDGHTKIGMIGAKAHLTTTLERNTAYYDAMKGLGLDMHFIPSDSMRNSSPGCYRKLIDEGCTAIIVSNERMTEDLVNYQYRNGIGLNQGAVLVGFMAGENPNPTLDRVIVQPSEEMGKYAADRILKLINGEIQKPAGTQFEARYVKE